MLSGTGTAGQLLGLRNVAGIETVAWASTTPTAVELQRRVADAVQRISGALYAPPNAIVLHPRRWAWLLTQNDTSNRPLVVPDASGAANAMGSLAGNGEGRVGTFAGLSVYVDSDIPTDVNTNQDVILVLNTGETILYESGIRTRVLPEVLSGTLTVRLQVWGYVALAPGRPSRSPSSPAPVWSRRPSPDDSVPVRQRHSLAGPGRGELPAVRERWSERSSFSLGAPMTRPAHGDLPHQ